MSKVIVFGSMNMDLSIDAPRVPVAGETLSGSGFLANAGGKGANQAVASARLGAPTHMIAAVGEDAFGEQLTAGLAAAGVDVSRVRRLSGAGTGVAVILRTCGENRIVLSAGANHALSADEVISDLRGLAEPGDVFLVQGECDLDATLVALRVAHGLGLYTVLNPAPARPLPEGLWASVDLVCLNETECAALCDVLPSDEGSCLVAARLLRSLGAGAVVITLGASGSFGLGSDDAPVRVAAVPPRAVADTTGAGDTFIGALVAGRVRGLSLGESMAWGSAAASLAVSRVGAQRAIPTADEVAALVGEGSPAARPRRAEEA